MQRTIRWTVVLFFILGILYLLELKLYLTWIYWWYDMVMHFLGGSVAGLAILIFLKKFVNLESWSLKKLLWGIVLGTLFIGVIWEVYELYFGFTTFADGWNYVTDTSSDLILDVVGGIFFGLISLKKWIKS